MKIREIMTTDVTSAELNTTLEEIATIMKHEDVGSVPIMDDGELVGLVTDRDIVIRCVAEGCDPGESTAESLVTDRLITVTPDDSVENAAAMMSRHQIRRLPVVDGEKLVGMLSLGDIAVKRNDDRVSGEALENISEGVKRNGDRGQERAQRSRKDEQGIGNRSAAEEHKHQQQVVPIRSDEKPRGARRNPGRKTG